MTVIRRLQSPHENNGIANESALPEESITQPTKEAAERMRSERNGSEVDLAFQPYSPDLNTTWCSHAKTICCINPYPNGITMSMHRNPGAKVNEKEVTQQKRKGCKDLLPTHFHLRFRDTRDYQLPPGKYYLYKDNYESALQKALHQLRRDEMLDKTVVYFGHTVDPFQGLNKKFDVTMTCLELLQQYRPGLTVVQSRSPMVISALGLLKMMEHRVVIGIPIETRLESLLQKFTPGQPSLKDRFTTANGLRAQGLNVNLVASPILPYGEYYRDAWEFAELLERHGDYITLGCLASGEVSEESKLRALPLSRRLAAEGQYRLLRPYAHRQLYYALKVVAPNKLLVPTLLASNASQLSLFAA